MIYEKSKTKNISFPLGGLGTGSVGLSGNGELIDWEIFNRPEKGSKNGYSHFAIKAKYADRTVVKVLHGDTNENYIGTLRHTERHEGFGYGPKSETMAGFPHFRSTRFEGNFPIASLTFSDPEFPATARLCAFNPFIPHDDLNSGLPAAFFEWEIENTTEQTVEYAIAFTVQNPSKPSRNRFVDGKAGKGVFLGSELPNEDVGYKDLAILTDGANCDAQVYWYRGGWQDGITTFWNNFSGKERLPKREYEEAGAFDHATIAAYTTIEAGQKGKIRFVLAWNAPNQYNYWIPCKDENGKDVTWKNYYATQFEDSRATAEYALENFARLYDETARFSRAIQNSTLPDFAIDAISANLSVLKSPTVLRYEDGTFWGWEGCNETTGSCEGSCQHVWNYAYAMPFLFPKLERSVRESFMDHATFESGETLFRVPLPLGRELKRKKRACVDGQMGEVIKCYREWKISGDTEWLKKYSSKIFKMLEFAWSDENPDEWDKDRDGVIEGRQHHTLDMELFGPNSWLEGFYLLALDCGAKIADAVGDPSRAKEYRRLYEKGKKWTNEHLFNGKYFSQKIDLKDKALVEKFGAQNYWNDEAGEIKYQIGDGCIIDQTLADWHAALIGADGVFDKEKKRTALENLYKNNYKRSMREVVNTWRNFALNDESGAVICSYPDGTYKPAIPVPYCEETMTGFEYALAGLLLLEGFIEEGETLVKSVRDRYDGEKRNPWNEIECGSNYARSMASYALLLIYSGFSFDLSKNFVGFEPLKKGCGQYLWSVGGSWGTVSFTEEKIVFSVKGNAISLSAFGLSKGEKAALVRIDGKEISFKQRENVLYFDETPVQNALTIELL